MRRKYINKKCTLNIERGNVTLIIETDNKNKDIFVAPNNKEPRVISPLPDIEKLISNAKYFSSRETGDSTVEGFLNKYIQGRDNEINEQIIEIRKSIKRIERAMECIDMVQKHMAKP